MRKAGVLEMRRLLQLCSVGLVVLAAAAGLSAPLARAQGFQVAPNSTSTIPLSARYEIVASPIASRWTFRLDRVCGHVALLVTTVDGGKGKHELTLAAAMVRRGRPGSLNLDPHSGHRREGVVLVSGELWRAFLSYNDNLGVRRDFRCSARTAILTRDQCAAADVVPPAPETR